MCARLLRLTTAVRIVSYVSCKESDFNLHQIIYSIGAALLYRPIPGRVATLIAFNPGSAD